MRITFVSASLDMSGGSRVISTHAKMLAERGHHVQVVAIKRRPARLRDRIKSLFLSGHWDPYYGSPSHYDGLGLPVSVVDQAPLSEADVPDADVIVATWWETAEWINAFSPRKGTKVYFVQGHEVFDNLPVERSRATYYMPFYKIVVSGWLQRIMTNEYGDTSAVLVPNAVSHDVFNAPARNKQPVPTLGFMYARAKLKGWDTILAAIALVRQTIPDLRVVCFGAEHPDVKEGWDGIEFQLMPSSDQIRQAYVSCDVWLCASRSEGFGLPAMEAMACRTPVASTEVGWPLDAIRTGENGYLVPIGDVQKLADSALHCLQLDDAAWQAMSERAFETAREVTWARSSAAFEAALKAACEGHLGAKHLMAAATPVPSA